MPRNKSKRRRISLYFLILGMLIPYVCVAEIQQQVPDESFQGLWNVEQHYFRGLKEGETNFEVLGEESPKGRHPATEEVRFRRHKDGAIQRIWTDKSGTVVRSKGITIIEASKNGIVFRPWSDHPTWNTYLTLSEDGSMVLQIRSLKHQKTLILRRG